MGSFWFRCKDLAVLRQVFVAKVVSQAASGLAAYAWSQADSSVVEGAMCRLLRNVCSNNMFEKNERGMFLCSYDNRELVGVFGLASHFTEIRVQRLLMMQSWAKSPEKFQQPIGALFGKWKDEKMTDLDKMADLVKHLRPATNGRAKSFKT